MSPPSWAVVIPAFNAASHLEAVLTGISRCIAKERILVVDDGSFDFTAAIARASGVALWQRAENGGKGRALRDGFIQVLRWNPDWILCLDADGQHDPALIPDFLAAAQSGAYDLLIGNRRQGLSLQAAFPTAMPRLRQLSNRWTSALLSWRTGLTLPDVQCGYRAIRAEFLRGLQLRSTQYEIEAEMILQAWKLGLRIGWVAIPALYRGETSFIRTLPDTWRFIRLFIRSLYHVR